MSDLSSRYSDLLDGSDDPDFAQFLARVEEAHQVEPPSVSQRLPSGEGLATTTPPNAGDGMRHSPPRAPALRAMRIGWPSTGTRLGLLLALAAVISTGAVLAASTIFNLGKPTNAVSTNQYFPLSSFHHVKGLQPAGKTDVLFIGTLTPQDIGSAVERWPLVKALQQFGTFSHLVAVDRVCTPDVEAKRDLCSLPTFDWTHAAYRSRYLTFEAKEVLRLPLKAGQNGCTPYQRLNHRELALYKRFVHVHASPADHCNPYGVFVAINQRVPLVVAGNYVGGLSQIVHPGDFEEQVLPGGPPPTPAPGTSGIPTYASGLSFAQVEHALQTQTDPKGTNLVEDVNAEVNIVSAIICRTDGLRPSGVCGRPIIQQILRRVK